MADKEKSDSKEYLLVEIPTATELMIQTPTGEVVNVSKAVVELLNITTKILKQLEWLELFLNLQQNI